jgi:hypothetical protein
MAAKRNHLWLISLALVSFAAGLASKGVAFGRLRFLVLQAVVAVLVLYIRSVWKNGKVHRRAQLSEQGKMMATKRAPRAEERLLGARAQASSYGPLINEVSDALGLEPGAAWRAFSEAFLVRSSAGDGVDAAFASSPRYAGLDWRDVDGLEDLIARVPELPPGEPFGGMPQGTDLQSRIQAFDAWLPTRDHLLMQIDTGSDTCRLLVLRQVDAPALLRVPTPDGVSIDLLGKKSLDHA